MIKSNSYNPRPDEGKDQTMGNVAAKFETMAAALRDTMPRVDDPFWNFYHNSVVPGHVKIIEIPIVFLKGDESIAEARFRCLGSPRQLASTALARTIAQHPALDWDAVKINYGPSTPREQAEAKMKADPMVAYSDYKLTSAVSLMNEFNLNMDGIDFKTASSAQLRAMLEDNHAKVAGRICGGAHEVEWTTGGPARGGFMSGLRKMLGRGQ